MTTDWNAVSAFMAQVVAWPGVPTDPGYVNLHYSMVDKRNPGGKKIVTGWPTRDVGSFIQKAAWALSTNYIKDLWFCTSLQGQAGKNSKGNPKALRGAALAVSQKSLWIDMDVGPDPKKYATVQEALAAVLAFQHAVGLPKPSAIVFSGNGVHVYWISKVPLAPADWAQYASGLRSLLLANTVKCDSGLTTDIARILRVPGTLNHKTEPPKPVQLSPTPMVLYDFETQLSFLKQFAGPQALPILSKPASVFADGANLESFKRPPAFKLDGPDLNAGIDKQDDVLLPAAPIFKSCGFLRQAILNGGKDYDNTLWMYSVLCSTFMENGNAIAHAISKGHATYSEADTQALYDRKVAERHDRGIGYPSCATIQGAGCASCASCPLLSKGKSPLNIREKPVTATVTGTVTTPQTAPARALNLPISYDVNAEGIVCKVIEITTKEGEVLPPKMIPLFQCKLSNFWAQKHPDCLNYTVTVDKGFTHEASVPHEEMSRQGFRAYLANASCRTMIRTEGAPYLEDFYLSMLGKLRAEAAAQQAVPFGWYEVNGARKGFCYGGQVMEDDGTVRSCGIGDPIIKRQYTPAGSLQPWYDACATVTARKRPELTCIMLMSFAAPLIELAGKNSVMYSVWGDTAAGKSSAFTVGMAVWGHPILTKGTKSSTSNQITHLMKEVRNLPFYWDEITDDKYRERVADVMHETSDGAEKGRMLSGHKMQDRGMFKVPIMAAANDSYVEYLQTRNTNHAASIVRVLEWKVQKINGGPGYMNDADASAILAKLQSNYGQMGLKYSHFLAMNHMAIEQEVLAKCNAIQDAMGDGTENRFWYLGVAIMALAAKYAQQLGVDVDPVEIEKFMSGVYIANRSDRDDRGMVGGVSDNTEVALGRYLKERGAEGRMIWTNYMHNKPGKPPRPVIIYKQPEQTRNGGVEIRWAVENRQLIISDKDFGPWLKEKKVSRKQTYDALEKEYSALFNPKLSIGSGTTYAPTSREPCIIIPIRSPAHPLWDSLMLYTSPEAREAAEAAAPPEAETCLTPADNVIAFVNGAVRG